MDSNREPGIRINQIFLGVASFEHEAAWADKPVGTPIEETTLNLSVTGGTAEDEREGIAVLRVETTPESKGPYRFAVEWACIVAVEPGKENMTIPEYINSNAAPTLYPFARETVASLTGKGRFGPIWLKPLNFAMARQQTVDAEEKAPRRET